MSELEDLARNRSAPPAAPSLEDLAKNRTFAGHGHRLPARRTYAPPATPTYSFICPNPNCGYIGHPRSKARGSIIVFFFLLLLGGLPGILYALFTSGYEYSCPRCNMFLRSDLIR